MCQDLSYFQLISPNFVLTKLATSSQRVNSLWNVKHYCCCCCSGYSAVLNPTLSHLILRQWPQSLQLLTHTHISLLLPVIQSATCRTANNRFLNGYVSHPAPQTTAHPCACHHVLLRGTLTGLLPTSLYGNTYYNMRT